MNNFRALMNRFFGIREGELYRALSMQLNIFLIITTLLVLKPTINSLFLSTYGIKSLPIAFILVAIIAGLVTTLYSKILQVFRFDYLVSGTLVLSVLSLLFFGISLRTGFLGNSILYLFYIWVAIFALLATSQFWLLANMVFNVREIKRLVGFIGAGAIAGGVFGGYLTSILTKYISSIDLPFVGAFFISLCIPLTISIWKRNSLIPTVVEKKQEAPNEQHPLRIILQSRHLTILAGIVAVSNIVAKLVDYQFSDVASSLITDPERLTAFFGFWFSTFNVVSLLIQLVLTRIIVDKYGVATSLLALPIMIGLSAILLIIAPELLLAAILMKMADGSLKQSINKSAMELLFLPIDAPAKNKAKPFIDVFIDSLATGLSGLILIFVVQGLSLSTNAINIIILGFVFSWLIMVHLIRKAYLQAFKKKILDHVSPGEVSVVQMEKGTMMKNLQKVLQTGTTSQILNALARIRPIKDKKLYQTIHALLQHPSPEVRVEALNHLYHYKNKSPQEDIERMTQDLSSKVKMAALSYLIEHAPLGNLSAIDKHLDSADVQLSGLALVSLATEMRSNPKLQRKYNLENRIQQKLKSIPQMRNAKERYLTKIFCIKAIAQSNNPKLYPYIQSFFKAKNNAVTRQALLAAGKTQSEYFLKDLLLYLTKPAFARTAQKALQEYQNKIVPYLRKLIAQDELNIKILRKCPALVRQIPTSTTIRFLFALLEYKDARVRQEALKVLSELHNNRPTLRIRKRKILMRVLDEVMRYQDVLAMIHLQKRKIKHLVEPEEVIKARKRVMTILRKRLTIRLDNIFKLLQLRYSKENLFAILKGLRSRKMHVKITALEFLDNILEPQLRKTLIPLFEATILNRNSSEIVQQLNLPPVDEETYFETILREGRDLRLKMATLHLIESLGEYRYIELVEECTRLSDPELKLYARSVLQSLEKEGAKVLRLRRS